MNGLMQLIYISSEAIPYDEGKLLGLLELAKKNNSHHNVTGLLLYQDSCFMQVIEGPDKEIEQLFKNIQNDKTHKNVMCLSRSQVTEREFPEWSMSFKHITRKENPEGISDFLLQKQGDELTSSTAKILLLSFKKTHGLQP